MSADPTPSPAGFPLDRLNADESVLLWEAADELYSDPNSIKESVVKHATYSLARTRVNFDSFSAYNAAALSVRDRLLKNWNPTQQHFFDKRSKRVYYLSLEFLIGRSLQNSLLNIKLEEPYQEAIRALGYSLEELYEQETDAALGNGGLGRLAACFMDSLATLDYPAWGYGIRYKYGMFAQKIVDGRQVEHPDYWLNFGNPWEIPRKDVAYSVRFYGEVRKTYDAETDTTRADWTGGEVVQAVAYDVPIPGYGTRNCINIRLWSSAPAKEFDLNHFNQGNYGEAIEEKRRSEDISAVLYPNDNTSLGKLLRLRQQFFFVRATLQDILRRFKKLGRPLSDLKTEVSIQLNDTHPSLSVVELQRILVDEEGLSWADAWDIVTSVFSYTNHTVLPEALEKWAVPMLSELLPRHMDIIYDINYRFLQQIEAKFPGDMDRLARMSLIHEGDPQSVRMAHLAIVGSHAVNGVAVIHSELLKSSLFVDFVEFYGADKFQNKTNGVTPRRWLNQANAELSAVITQWLEGDSWLKNLDELQELRAHASNPELIRVWREVKAAKKQQLANYIKENVGVEVDPTALFDVQVKRIHEYKRQFMNILYCISRYLKIKSMTPKERESVQPRVTMFGGKAAPGYYRAKHIILLINEVGKVVNNDPDIGDLFKVVFIPNYNVSVAEVIIPASEISQHISTAGMEASGTSNMKFALNGGLIIGTMDGANVEIAEQIGEENMFIFGKRLSEIAEARHAVRFRPQPLDARLAGVIAAIRNGTFGDHQEYEGLINTITNGNDYYLVTADYASYCDAQAAIDDAYADQDEWTKKSILSTAGMGFFSSDRTIRQYAEEIWNVQPCPLPESGTGNIYSE